MNPTLAIAGNAFREAIRDRVLYLIVFFAVLVILGSEGVAILAVGSTEKVVLDLGLGAISFFGVLLSVFLGLSLVSREIDRRTVYTVVTKPIPRGTFVVGKLIGLLATVGLCIGAMSALFLAFAWLRYDTFSSGLLQAIWLSLVEDLVVACFALLFSTFTSPILGMLFTITLYVVGHLSFGLKMLAELPGVRETLFAGLFRALYLVLPNLERFNVRGAVVHGDPVSAEYLIAASGYGLTYSIVVLALAMAAFSRRDFV